VQSFGQRNYFAKARISVIFEIGTPPAMHLASRHRADRDRRNQGVFTMFATTVTRQIAAIACTIVMSATCLLGALAPAHVATTTAPVATIEAPIA